MCAQSNCNAQATDASGNVLADFHNANIGVPPCTLQVTNGGAVIIADANNVTWSSNAAPVLAVAGSGQITAGQILNQVSARACRALSAPSLARSRTYLLSWGRSHWCLMGFCLCHPVLLCQALCAPSLVHTTPPVCSAGTARTGAIWASVVCQSYMLC